MSTGFSGCVECDVIAVGVRILFFLKAPGKDAENVF